MRSMSLRQPLQSPSEPEGSFLLLPREELSSEIPLTEEQSPFAWFQSILDQIMCLLSPRSDCIHRRICVFKCLSVVQGMAQ